MHNEPYELNIYDSNADNVVVWGGFFCFPILDWEIQFDFCVLLRFWEWVQNEGYFSFTLGLCGDNLLNPQLFIN